MRLAIIGLLTLSTLSAQSAVPRPIKCGFGRLHTINMTPARDGQSLTRPVKHKSYETPDHAFLVHFDTTGTGAPPMTISGGGTTPDWVVDVGAAFSAARDTLQSWGFRDHVDDGDGLYDVYLKNYRGGTYGETTPENIFADGSTTSYIMMDNDFADDESYYTHNLPGAQVTAAHEYFHAVQLSYIFRVSDIYLFELSSTWFEERAFPGVNDWTFWMDEFVEETMPQLSTGDGYSAAFFGHYLTSVYTIDVIEEVWANILNVDALGAIIQAVEDRGGDLATDWGRSVTGLLANGIDPTAYYHEDQALLPRPELPLATDILSGATLTAEFLAVDKVIWLPVQLGLPATLNVRLTSDPADITTQVALVHGRQFTMQTLSDPWAFEGLNALSTITLAVSGSALEASYFASLTDINANFNFSIGNVYPNPIIVSAGTGITIPYTVGKIITLGHNAVTIYNILGQTMFRQQFVQSIDVGSYQHFISPNALTRIPSGVYIVQLDLDGRHHLSQKITLLR